MISRLDRLEPPDRDLLCQASVQGVEFDLDVLEIVRRRMGVQEPAVQRQLPVLQSRGFLTTRDRRQQSLVVPPAADAGGLL